MEFVFQFSFSHFSKSEYRRKKWHQMSIDSCPMMLSNMLFMVKGCWSQSQLLMVEPRRYLGEVTSLSQVTHSNRCPCSHSHVCDQLTFITCFWLVRRILVRKTPPTQDPWWSCQTWRTQYTLVSEHSFPAKHFFLSDICFTCPTSGSRIEN